MRPRHLHGPCASGRREGGSRAGAQNMQDNVPIAFILQNQNVPKLPLKLAAEERSIWTPAEIERYKHIDNDAAREELRRRNEFILEAKEAAERPEPIVPTPAPDPPLPPKFDALDHSYRRAPAATVVAAHSYRRSPGSPDWGERGGGVL